MLKRLEDYTDEQTLLIRNVTLSVATVLGDYLNDLVIVGGLVPSLIIPSENIPAGDFPHIGTMDLDLGLDLYILNEKRYASVSELMLNAGFEPDRTDRDHTVRQRWVWSKNPKLKVDFLIPKINEDAEGGKLQNLTPDFAAIITPGLELAFLDRIPVTITGSTIWGEKATRTVYACNPGSFIILKAMAFHLRREPKDAYDLHFMIRYYGNGIDEVAASLLPLLETKPGQKALGYLRDGFLEEDATGPVRVVEFLGQSGDEANDTKADVVGDVTELLRSCCKL